MKAYLDAMMAQINNKFERVLDEITTLRADFHKSNNQIPSHYVGLGSIEEARAWKKHDQTWAEFKKERLDKAKKGRT